MSCRSATPCSSPTRTHSAWKRPRRRARGRSPPTRRASQTWRELSIEPRRRVAQASTRRVGREFGAGRRAPVDAASHKELRLWRRGALRPPPGRRRGRWRRTRRAARARPTALGRGMRLPVHRESRRWVRLQLLRVRLQRLRLRPCTEGGPRRQRTSSLRPLLELPPPQLPPAQSTARAWARQCRAPRWAAQQAHTHLQPPKRPLPARTRRQPRPRQARRQRHLAPLKPARPPPRLQQHALSPRRVPRRTCSRWSWLAQRQRSVCCGRASLRRDAACHRAHLPSPQQACNLPRASRPMQTQWPWTPFSPRHVRLRAPT
mmetsp:Transcript_25761/g.69639  ORF Transcript_25761/g.69639 Transcript_25761/m.69639 type:complete len:318 (+) Transcript_25761:1012-1965(+)